MPVDGQAVCSELAAFVSRVCTDTVFRRELRYDPGGALRRSQLETDRIPNNLGVRHYEVSAEITTEVLLAPGVAAGAVRPVATLPLEIRLVRYGLKPLALVHAPAVDAAALRQECEAHGMAALLSPDAFQPIPDPAAGNYVNIAGDRRPAGPALTGWRGVVVARDWRQAMLGWLSLLFGWDEFLGLLLGYPSCCVRSYRANWQRACEEFGGEVALVLLAAETAAAGDGPVTAQHRCMNLLARYFGYHVTDHFACSFRCAATASLGERLLRGLAGYEPQFCRELDDRLAAPVLYQESGGVFLFDQARWLDDTTFEHGAVLATMPHTSTARRLCRAHVASTREAGQWMIFPAEGV